jgi:hypothetical protein
MAAHAASLIFGAFWLVATSSEPGPARDCFTGIANPTRLEITLGERSPVGSDSGVLPPCDGIDGLAINGTLVLDLSQGPRPQDGGGCWGYDTDALSGANGVSLGAVPEVDENGTPLTFAAGTFVSPDLPGCVGTWSLVLYRAGVMLSGELASPLEAGPNERWIVERRIRSNQPSLCVGTFARAGVLTCGDQFSVTSIRELATP